jgi:hypothetical protein
MKLSLYVIVLLFSVSCLQASSKAVARQRAEYLDKEQQEKEKTIQAKKDFRTRILLEAAGKLKIVGEDRQQLKEIRNTLNNNLWRTQANYEVYRELGEIGLHHERKCCGLCDCVLEGDIGREASRLKAVIDKALLVEEQNSLVVSSSFEACGPFVPHAQLIERLLPENGGLTQKQ